MTKAPSLATTGDNNMIESFDTLFSKPDHELTIDEVKQILLADDLQDSPFEYFYLVMMDGFVGYNYQTDDELRTEYQERRNLQLMTFGTDEENGMGA